MARSNKYRIWLVVILLAIFAIAIVSNILSNNNSKPQEESKIYCNTQSRDVDVCTEIYSPVCGWFDSSKIQCIKYPCAQTFSNSCFVCMDEKVEYYTEGECPA
ncbi:MAG: hypothetical protein AABW63_01060 [Nanoarchaeota archaeon]